MSTTVSCRIAWPEEYPGQARRVVRNTPFDATLGWPEWRCLIGEARGFCANVNTLCRRRRAFRHLGQSRLGYCLILGGHSTGGITIKTHAARSRQQSVEITGISVVGPEGGFQIARFYRPRCPAAIIVLLAILARLAVLLIVVWSYPVRPASAMLSKPVFNGHKRL
jgi:hypothetical protein